MMTVINQGSSQSLKLEDVLDVVRNEKIYTQRLEALNKATNEYSDAVAKLTKAKDLDEALKSAKQAEDYAKSLAKDAKDKAAKLERDAENQALSIVDEANQYKANLERETENKKRELNDATVNLALVNTQLTAARDGLSDLKAQSNKLTQENAQLRNDVEAKRAALKALLG